MHVRRQPVSGWGSVATVTPVSPLSIFSKVLYDICYFISACIVVSGFGKTKLGPIGISISHPLSFLFSFRFFLIFPSSPLPTGLPIVMARNMTVRRFRNLPIHHSPSLLPSLSSIIDPIWSSWCYQWS